VGAPVKNRIADEIVHQLQTVAQEVWQQEIDQLVKLFDYEIKAKDGESWLKQTRARDAAILAKLQQLRELAKHYSGTVHLTGVNAEIEKEAEALLLAEIAKAADEPSFQTLKGRVIDAAKLNGGDDA
jgi:hypothetical protein